MSYSLAITNGDLSYGTNGLNTVTGSAKLVQDLSTCILEPLGTDYNDPDFGSIIEGGIDSEGTVYPGLIGSVNDNDTSTLIQSELQRICLNYQNQQVGRNQEDVYTYGNSTLTAGEALLDVDDVQVQQIESSVYVSLLLNTGTGSIQLATGIGS